MALHSTTDVLQPLYPEKGLTHDFKPVVLVSIETGIICERCSLTHENLSGTISDDSDSVCRLRFLKQSLIRLPSVIKRIFSYMSFSQISQMKSVLVSAEVAKMHTSLSISTDTSVRKKELLYSCKSNKVQVLT